MENRSELPVLELPVEGSWKVMRSSGHAEFAFDLAAVEGSARGTLACSRLRHAVIGVDDLALAEAPPFVIDRYERLTSDGWSRVQNEPLRKGEVVRSPGETYWRLTLESGLRVAEARLKWAEEALQTRQEVEPADDDGG